jgi:DNA-binding protein HU-beta
MFLGNAVECRREANHEPTLAQGLNMSNKADLVAKVQELAQLESKASAERSVTAVLEALVEGLKKDKTVALVGFGTFEVKERKARTGVNPATGEKIKIAASKTVGFKAGKALKDEFNKAKAAKKK